MPLILNKGFSQETKPEQCREAWVGSLKLGHMEPVFQFRIMVPEGGSPGAYFDSITEGLLDFPAEWSKQEGQLHFEIAKIKGAFQGTLNEAGDTAEGTWRQANQEMPLTLKKQACK